MKKLTLMLLVLFIAALISLPAQAQSPILYSWQDTITNSLGQVLPNATVIILSGTVTGARAVNTTGKPGTPLATIYADPYAATPINQTTSPITTAAGNGTFQFWAAAGYYVVQAYGRGINGQLVYGIAIGPTGQIPASSVAPGSNNQCFLTLASVATWGACLIAPIAPSNLSPGTNGQCVVTSGSVPAWGSCAGTAGVQLLNVNVSPVTVNAVTTGVQKMMTYTVSAGVLNSANKTIRITSIGHAGVANFSTTTLDLTWEVGGNNIQIPTAPPSPFNLNDNVQHPWKSILTCTTTSTGAAGGMLCELEISTGLANAGAQQVYVYSDIPTGAIDLTSGLEFDAPIVSYSVASASNSATQDSMLVELMN